MDKETEDLIIALIDRGTWKHSWHLELDQWGHYDWYFDRNIKECLAQCDVAKSESARLLRLVEKIEPILKERLAEIENEQALEIDNA